MSAGAERMSRPLPRTTQTAPGQDDHGCERQNSVRPSSCLKHDYLDKGCGEDSISIVLHEAAAVLSEWPRSPTVPKKHYKSRGQVELEEQLISNLSSCLKRAQTCDLEAVYTDQEVIVPASDNDVFLKRTLSAALLEKQPMVAALTVALGSHSRNSCDHSRLLFPPVLSLGTNSQPCRSSLESSAAPRVLQNPLLSSPKPSIGASSAGSISYTDEAWQHLSQMGPAPSGGTPTANSGSPAGNHGVRTSRQRQAALVAPRSANSNNNPVHLNPQREVPAEYYLGKAALGSPMLPYHHDYTPTRSTFTSVLTPRGTPKSSKALDHSNSSISTISHQPAQQLKPDDFSKTKSLRKKVLSIKAPKLLRKMSSMTSKEDGVGCVIS